MRAPALVMMVLSLACRPEATTPPAPDAGPKPEATDEVAEADDDQTSGELRCEPLVDEAQAEADHARGVATLEQARDGEHYLAEPFAEGMQALLSAAEQGHRTAQSLYGRRSFENMFLVEAPRPEEREAYIVALSFIRIAGQRGDSDAAGYLPGLLEQPDLTASPFDQIPADWVREAISRADAWMSCHGATVGDRGASP